MSNQFSTRIRHNVFLFMHLPRFFLKFGQDIPITKKILLLGTIGRKTGKLRFTPLQYEFLLNTYYLGSMRGKHADWVKNLQNHSKVYIQITKEKRFYGYAKVLDDQSQVLSFLKLSIDRNPTMIPFILEMYGIKDIHNDISLMNYAKKICVVKISNLQKI